MNIDLYLELSSFKRQSGLEMMGTLRKNLVLVLFSRACTSHKKRGNRKRR